MQLLDAYLQLSRQIRNENCGPELSDNGNLKELLLPYPADEMRTWEISPRVNSAGK
jgi:hypothetical protein